MLARKRQGNQNWKGIIRYVARRASFQRGNAPRVGDLEGGLTSLQQELNDRKKGTSGEGKKAKKGTTLRRGIPSSLHDVDRFPKRTCSFNRWKRGVASGTCARKNWVDRGVTIGSDRIHAVLHEKIRQKNAWLNSGHVGERHMRE